MKWLKTMYLANMQVEVIRATNSAQQQEIKEAELARSELEGRIEKLQGIREELTTEVCFIIIS